VIGRMMHEYYKYYFRPITQQENCLQCNILADEDEPEMKRRKVEVGKRNYRLFRFRQSSYKIPSALDIESKRDGKTGFSFFH